MAKWRVSFEYDEEFEAEDEGDALIQAEFDFDLMSCARVEWCGLIEEEESGYKKV